LAEIDLTGPRTSKVVMIRKSLTGEFQMPAAILAEFSPDPLPEAVPGSAVRDQLAQILNSSGFASSTRLCRFLTHIVNRTLDGDADSIKEFSIAMEVFDRTADYDPNIDAIVRVEARRLRAKLKAYYETANDPVLIELRPGSYVPSFRCLGTGPVPEQRQDAQPRRRPSLAVLPFVNMSPEPEQDYFCDGISEEILNSLTHLPELDVIARTSSFQFKGVAIDIRDVGQRLGADLVIEGSVRKAGEQLRITAQAVETACGHHLWSETFGRELKDVFAIQEAIARAVADLLRVHAPARPASAGNLDVYTKYLRAAS
jgi:TolB-like protein